METVNGSAPRHQKDKKRSDSKEVKNGGADVVSGPRKKKKKTRIIKKVGNLDGS